MPWPGSPGCSRSRRCRRQTQRRVAVGVGAGHLGEGGVFVIGKCLARNQSRNRQDASSGESSKLVHFNLHYNVRCHEGGLPRGLVFRFPAIQSRTIEYATEWRGLARFLTVSAFLPVSMPLPDTTSSRSSNRSVQYRYWKRIVHNSCYFAKSIKNLAGHKRRKTPSAARSRGGRWRGGFVETSLY